MMTKFGGRAAVAAALVATSLAVAGPAGADDLTGTYSVLGRFGDGTSQTTTWELSACGSDCRTLVWAGKPPQQLQLHGTAWTGLDAKGCTTELSANTLAGTWLCPGDPAPVFLQATHVS